MAKMNYEKYKRYETVKLKDRTWPDKVIEQAPMWCSVDLRDGNQALIEPMSVEEKLEMFKLLVDVGFKEIEIGFPSASQIEFDFARTLVENNLIPADVTVQVLTQAREHLIIKTFEALKGVKKAVVHLYNSTSTLQRDVVFGKSKKEIIDIAVEGTKLVKKHSEMFDGEIVLEYSPESFTGTEMDYALEICEEVIKVWQPTKENRIIINLPATVEMSTPNMYADQIEWFGRNLKQRENVIISLHAHNDRGTGVAATELALMAGADRVEGTLFGNGERTGNADIINIALNLFSQGIDPKLDFSDINNVKEIYERCCKMVVHPRHPYVGDLVYTAFSGSHQDAINKGMNVLKSRNAAHWEVPYLPIDPSDLGRKYESLVRINSQSGKGGVAFIMESVYGFKLPKSMHPEFAAIIQKVSEVTGKEVLPEQIYEEFKKEFLDKKAPYKMKSCQIKDFDNEEAVSENRTEINVNVELVKDGREIKISGNGNGPIDAFKKGLKENGIADINIEFYHEHALDKGSDSRAVAYIQIADENGKKCFGAGIDTNIAIASIKAMIGAINRL